MNSRSQNIFIVLSIIFITILLVSNIIAQKTIVIGGYTTVASLVVFPLVYVLSSIFTEVWGIRKARLVLGMGLVANILMSLLFILAVEIPGSAGRTAAQASAFNGTLDVVWMIVAASMVAYLIGCSLNNYIIAKMQVRQNGKNMALRFGLGNIAGTLVDSILFAGILNYALLPGDANTFFTLIAVAFVIKRLYTLVAMVISVPLTGWLKRVAARESM